MKCLLALPLVFLSLSILPAGINTGRILVGYAPDNKSHLRSLLPFIHALVEAGQEVSVLYVYSNSSGVLEKLGPSVSPILLEIPTPQHMTNVGKMVWSETLHGYLLPIFYHIRSFSAHTISSSPLFTEVLNTEWDFVLVSELFALHAYAMASALNKRYNVPYAMFGSSRFTSGDSYRTGLAQNWVSEAAMFGPIPRDSRDFYSPRDFCSRLINVAEQASENLVMAVVDLFSLSPKVGKLTGKTDFSLTGLLHRSSLYFTDSIVSLGQPLSTVPEMFNVGAHCEEAKELDEEYASFVEDPHSLGTIYIAFGTVIPWDSAPQWAKNAVFAALEQLSDYRVIFAYKGTFPTRRLRPHIKLVKWAPQLDILAHPNTRVFLTHAGLKSVKESLCTATPMLAMPMFAEQAYNAKAVLSWGIGNVLNKYHLSADGMVSALTEVLGNPAYGERVRKLRAIFLDRPMPAIAEGGHYVTRLIAKHQEDKRIARERMARENAKSRAFTNHAPTSIHSVPVPKLFFDRQGKYLSLCHYWNLDVIGIVTLISILLARK